MVKILGIETSCDETAAAIVDEQKNILSHVVSSHIAEHQPYGGVVPEISSRAHLRLIDEVIRKAFADAELAFDEIDAIAVTAGPGLIGGVIVGVMTAKAMALALDKPIIAVNHLEGHALTVRLTDDAPYPYLLMLASGGHCQILQVDGLGKYQLLGKTLDDALGECFDKVAKLLGLPYPGGPEVEKLAANGTVHEDWFPVPLKGRKDCDFSFSGLKTAVRQHIVANKPFAEQHKADICASFQWAATESLLEKLGWAMENYTKTTPPFTGGHGGEATKNNASSLVARVSAAHPVNGGTDNRRLVFAGGVAANQYVRGKLEGLCAQHGFQLFVPPIKLCTDNAAMIAWAGMEYFQAGMLSDLAFEPRANWSLYA